MEIDRAPRIGGYWTETDKKEPHQYIENWEPGRKIIFDGTIDKSGSRHTRLALYLRESDVEARVWLQSDVKYLYCGDYTLRS